MRAWMLAVTVGCAGGGGAEKLEETADTGLPSADTDTDTDADTDADTDTDTDTYYTYTYTDTNTTPWVPDPLVSDVLDQGNGANEAFCLSTYTTQAGYPAADNLDDVLQDCVDLEVDCGDGEFITEAAAVCVATHYGLPMEEQYDAQLRATANTYSSADPGPTWVVDYVDSGTIYDNNGYYDYFIDALTGAFISSYGFTVH